MIFFLFFFPLSIFFIAYCLVIFCIVYFAGFLLVDSPQIFDLRH